MPRSWYRLEKAAKLVREHVEKMGTEELKDNYEILENVTNSLEHCIDLNRIAEGVDEEPEDHWHDLQPGTKWRRKDHRQFTERPTIVEIVSVEKFRSEAEEDKVTFRHLHHPGVDGSRFLRNFLENYQPYNESGV